MKYILMFLLLVSGIARADIISSGNNAGPDGNVPIKLGDSTSIDAFGRMRVSNIETIFDSKQIYNGNILVWSYSTAGSGNYYFVTNTSKTRLTVTASAGDVSIKQTRQYFNYQPGKSQLVFITANFLGGVNGTTKSAGTYDAEDGLGFALIGNNPAFFVRSNTSGTPSTSYIYQSAWNGDKLNGTNGSNITIDWTKGQILWFDYEWLGVGRIRFGFVLEGKFILCHEITNLNALDNVYLSKPTLPVRYEILSSGAAGQMDAVCSSIMSEGGANSMGRIFSSDTTSTAKSITTALVPLIQIRIKSGRKNSRILSLGANIVTDSSSIVRWDMRINPTITGGSETWVSSGDDSSIEYGRSVTGTASGGIVIASGYLPGGTIPTGNDVGIQLEVPSSLGIGTDLFGVSDTLVLSVQAITGTHDFYGAIHWRELY